MIVKMLQIFLPDWSGFHVGLSEYLQERKKAEAVIIGLVQLQAFIQEIKLLERNENLPKQQALYIVLIVF